MHTSDRFLRKGLIWPQQLSTYFINELTLQGNGETYCVKHAYISTSEQSSYTPSSRIPYKTPYLHPTLRNKTIGLCLKKNKFGDDSVYLDFAKAFDTVSHARLLIKLTGYGIRGHILDRIKAFLSSRSQTV